MIQASIIADSVNPAGVRLTTYLLTYPKFIHGEVMTFRAASKNASSSRAIPTSKMIKEIGDTPAMPLKFLRNKPGMQGGEQLAPDLQDNCSAEIRDLRDAAIRTVNKLHSAGLHKQSANRYLEPWLHMNTLLSATDFANMFATRLHPDAQPEYQHLAYLMGKAMLQSQPQELKAGEWHLPFSDHIASETDLETKLRVCTGRCARTSYKNQEGVFSIEDDLKLFDRLISGSPGHWSPLEHCAKARNDFEYWDQETATLSNFRGFQQLRKRYSQENIAAVDLAQLVLDYEIRNGLETTYEKH